MKIVHNLTIAVILLMAVSCISSDQQDTATQLSVEVEERRPPLAASELFSSTDIVALEANDKSLIAGVDKVLMDKDFFAVVDKRSDKILTFRYDGSHIATINRKGRGPQEYVNMSNATIDTKGKHFVVYDDMTERVILYNYNGDWVKSIKHDVLIDELVAKDGVLYVAHYRTMDNSEDYIASIDLKSEEVKPIYGFPNQYDTNVGVRGTTLTATADGVLFTYILDNAIYEVRKGKAIAKYRFDFGSRNSAGVVNQGANPDELTDKIFDSKCIYALSNTLENDRYLLTSPNGFGYITYDKHTKEIGSHSTIRVSGMPMSTSNAVIADGSDNCIVSVLDVASLLRVKGYMEEDDYKDLDPKIAKILFATNEDSNPTLVFLKLTE